MSRVAKMPVKLPAGVQVANANGQLTVKGAKTSLTINVPAKVQIEVNGDVVNVAASSITADNMQAGTFRALLNNAVVGVSKGYERKLNLVGVTVETPTQTEILVKGADKKMVGQVAADIRGFRPPEPYKGKGVRYSTEKVELKEAKKK
jgi:large subunit ribosomal protein L6